MPFFVQCVPATDSVAVSPCGEVDGVGYEPVMVDFFIGPGFDVAQLQDLFVWSFTLVMMSFVTGYVVGLVMRVIRAT